MTGLLENVNIDELFQKLVASGIVPTPHHSDETESKPIVESKRSVEHHTVKYVDFSKPETLKQWVAQFIYRHFGISLPNIVNK